MDTNWYHSGMVFVMYVDSMVRLVCLEHIPKLLAPARAFHKTFSTQQIFWVLLQQVLDHVLNLMGRQLGWKRKIKTS